MDIRTVRALALSAGTGFPARFGTGEGGVLRAVAALGCVQIDTISVVRRAHEHILWSRVPDPGYAAVPALEGARGGKRRVVEYWAHAEAYLPIEEWRFCLPRMERIRKNGHEWFRTDAKAAEKVLARIASEGPLAARDFRVPGRKPGTWWDWKPEKAALEYLFHAGRLVAATRRGFQKVYDLAERQIPPEHAGPTPSESELSARHVRRAARSLGVFTKEAAVYQRKDGLEGMDRALEAAVESGELVKTTAEGQGSRACYADPGLLSRASSRRVRGPAGGSAFILSPFDPFLIDRGRCARIWDFGYTIECYRPAGKRAFGYFALPLLYVPTDPGLARFAGLLDAKADRKGRRLILRRLRLFSKESVSPAGIRVGSPPPGPVDPGALAAAAAAELARFAAFQDAETVELETLETDDPALEAAFRSALAHSAGAVQRGSPP